MYKYFIAFRTFYFIPKHCKHGRKNDLLDRCDYTRVLFLWRWAPVQSHVNAEQELCPCVVAVLTLPDSVPLCRTSKN